MTQSLIRLAKQARDDGSLLASLVDRYGAREGLHWEEVARQLQIEPVQLARLALCRRPRQSHFSQDVAQIASYTGLDRATLKEFLQRAERERFSLGLSERLAVFAKGADVLFKRQPWAFGIAAIVLFFVGAVAFAQPKQSEATLLVSMGQATVISSQPSLLPTTRARSELSSGEIMAVSANDEITVNAGSAAQLRLFDGSTVDLFEGSTVQVTELLTTQDSYRVRLHMLSGKTVSRVIRLLGMGDAFEVSTPSSTASVRGTVFSVEVIDSESTFIACDEGVVQVEMEAFQADVVAGTELMAISGQPLVVESQEEESDPPGPPDEVPGNPPQDVPGNTPAGDGDPPGPPDSVPANPPGRDGDPPGPPDSVPANPPGRDGDPPGPPDSVPADPPGRDGDPPGPPDSVPADPPGRDGDPPGPLDSAPANPPGRDGNPPGPPDSVPANPPGRDGDPPPGPPEKSRSKPPKGVPVGPPDQVPGNPPPDVPGQGNPPEGSGDPPGPPDSVPGNPPPDVPGQGNPPEGSGVPPGNGGEPPGQDDNDNANASSNDAGGGTPDTGSSGGGNGGGGGRSNNP